MARACGEDNLIHADARSKYPILAVMVVADGLQVANSGVLRGDALSTGGE